MSGYIPGFWMNETSGVLAPAVRAYLAGGPMSEADIAVMRLYLRHWIASPGFVGPEVVMLRRLVDGLTTRRALATWLELAERAGIDPL